ncbi:MAG TPA: hypothetical protein VF556_01320 [Pyrinomonadaceae bacterium]|jgi:hypothetical protein
MEVAEMTDSKREIFLVLRSQAGDKNAFDKLLKLIQQPLFRYIYNRHALRIINAIESIGENKS